MADQFTTVTTKGWGSRLLESIGGVLLGFVMFVASFGVLYWNEGRVDVSKIAKTATEISATTPASTEVNGKLISTTGIFKSDETIGDDYLKVGSYISLQRNVEMYAWKEETTEKTTKNTGGSETTETTYNYVKEWTSSPDSSANFKHPEDHTNPEMTLSENEVSVEKAQVGIYNVDVATIALPSYKDLSLSDENTILADGLNLANDQYLFKGTGTISSPVVGDMRLSYSVIANPINQATVFGTLDLTNSQITPFYGEKNTELFRAFEGTRDSAISTLKTEYTMMLWIFRGVGFFLMWVGLMALFGPISVFLDFLPIFGSIGRVGIGIITFIVSLVLSAITIILSMILHSLIAVIIVVLAALAGTIWYLKHKRGKMSGAKK